MASQESPMTAQQLHDQIIAAYQTHNFLPCLELIDISLKSGPNTHHQILQASCWTSLNINGPETYTMLKQIIAEEPRNSFAYYGLGLKHYSDGNLAECIDFLTKAIELNPTNAMQKASELKYKAKSVMEAICDANAKFEARSFEKALRSLSAALYADPENIKIQEKIADIKQFYIKELVEILEKEVKDELTETCKKLEIDEKVTKVEDLVACGKLENAEKVIGEAYEIGLKSLELDYVKSFLLYMQGKLKESIQVLDEVLKAQNDHKKAKELREKAAMIDELQNLAAEKSKQKSHEQAIEIWTKITKIDEKNVIITQSAFFQRSLSHFSMGNSTIAFADFKIFEAMQKENGQIKVEN